MNFLRPTLTALLIGVATPVVVAPAFAQTCACPTSDTGYAPGPVIQAEEPPPPLPVYEQPPMPAPGYMWTPGYWSWNNYDYYWVPGVWVPPPSPGLLWTPGYWAFVGGSYFFHQGYWGPHVGFYGGVDYGFGYNGLGYEGGRWEGSRFLYNTTVNNFGAVHVTNVYSQNVAAIPGAGRVSFNGGPGGVALRPTPEQERLTTEEHVRPTQLQVTQARTASMEALQFHSANQGKPAVAATARPGELKGPGAVPAKAAGSAELQPAPGATAPNGEERPGAKTPAGAPNLERRLPNAGTPPVGAQPGAPAQTPRANLNEKPPTPAETGPGQRLNTPAPLNAKPQERPAQEKAPGGPPKPEGAERPVRPEAAPNRETQAPQLQRPAPAAMAPGGERPRLEAMPGGPKGPPAAAERRPQRPEGKERECGKPGQPPCPR